MSKCVHELAKLTHEDEGFVEFREMMIPQVSTCGLVKAIQNGDVTVEQINGEDGQSITIGDLAAITSKYDPVPASA